MRHADRGGVHHRRVRGQCLLDLAGIHIESGDDDHLLLAIDDRDVSVRVDRRDVAGVQPAIAQGLRGLFGPLVVAVHELRPSEDELARLTGRHLLLACLEIDDLRLDVGVRNSDRANFLLPLPEERVAVRDWSVFATSARCESIAPFEMPVVPPVYWSTARSSGPVPASNGSAGAVSTSLKETAPGSPANGWRWPSVFSLASVKSTRRIGGISSLMFVTITCSTDAGAGAPGREATARAAFTTG